MSDQTKVYKIPGCPEVEIKWNTSGRYHVWYGGSRIGECGNMTAAMTVAHEHITTRLTFERERTIDRLAEIQLSLKKLVVLGLGGFVQWTTTSELHRERLAAQADLASGRGRRGS